ncbi:MAG: helix-turn-helix transcriptional regulator [Bdellovibrionales bacterium]
MRGLHENQRRILEYLLDHPDGATLDELVGFLGITKTAVKEHVKRIQDMGYLDFTDAKGAVGRPRRRYLLSSEGVEAFPKRYSWLSNVILAQLAKEMPPDKVAKFMRDLADTVAQSVEHRFVNASPVERLKKITQLLNELGYRAFLKESDPYKEAVIEAVNCVYHSVAKENPSLCGFDIRLLENASGMDVKLETCIARGGSVCRFCIRKK